MNKSEESVVEVFVRIRPIPKEDEDQRRCIILSNYEENTVIINANQKKELFSFDYIASEHCGQQQLYQKLGRPVILDSLRGYNCCVFSYGQTGAGKTYSIIGNNNDLLENSLSQTRGVLPRMLQGLFAEIQNPSNLLNSTSISCSYIQIYNEQIIDLMTKQTKNLTIRQDLKKGVFIDGLTQLSIHNYEQFLEVIRKGLTIKKTAATFMNAESSRSHTIFTLFINLYYTQGQKKKTVRSKIHVVDLAGSERIKLTKVQGQRLKEGCNINKSLLTLSHVISSLTESSRKKKHIPFRDSKLTFFLKDSLIGNSKIKLLANVSSKTAYIGDTISTLMFAKRANIIRSKVEPNQSVDDNFQTLRSQIKKLREQLSQTKFIKPFLSSQKNDSNQKVEDSQGSKDIFLPTESFITPFVYQKKDLLINQELIRTFQHNERCYRSITEHCLQKLKTNKENSITSSFKSLFQQKKNLQKVVINQQKLISNFPAFTKIFTQNLENTKKLKLLNLQLSSIKQQLSSKYQEINNLNNNIDVLTAQKQYLSLEVQELEKLGQISKNPSHMSNSATNQGKILNVRCASQLVSKVVSDFDLQQLKNRRSSVILSKKSGFRDIVQRQNSIIDQYQLTMADIKRNFEENMKQMRSAYMELQQMYEQQKRQKYEICKRKRKQPQLQIIVNQNQYLKLGIMELEAQVGRLQKQLFKKGVQVKTSKDQQQVIQDKLNQLQIKFQEQGIRDTQLEIMIQKIRTIKIQAEKADIQLNEQLRKNQILIEELSSKLSHKIKENHFLLIKNQKLNNQNSNLKAKLIESKKKDNCDVDDQTLQIENNLGVQKCFYEQIIQDLQKLTIENEKFRQQVSEKQQTNEVQEIVLQKASSKILSLNNEVHIYKGILCTHQQSIRELSQKIQFMQKEQRNNHEKMRLLDIDLTKLPKQSFKDQNNSSTLNLQHNSEIVRLSQEVRSLKDSNKLLSEQNQKLKKTLKNNQDKQLTIKNYKSMSSMLVGKQSVSASQGKTKTQNRTNDQTTSRQPQKSIKKTDQKKKTVIHSLDNQKQKCKQKTQTIQFKSKTMSQQNFSKFTRKLLSPNNK